MSRQFILVTLCVLAAVCLPAALARKDVASKSKDCVKGYLHKGDVTGTEVKFRSPFGKRDLDLDAYVSFPRTTKGRGTYPTVIIFSDFFGWKYNNSRQWCDKLAKNGFLAVMPDFFRGDPWVAGRNFSELPAWNAKRSTEQVMRDFVTVTSALRNNGVKGVRAGKLGAQGFCWGGLYGNLLATGLKNSVSASIVYHGSRLTVEQVKAVKTPIYYIKADPELDANFPPAIYNETVNIFAAKRKQGIDARIKYYPGHFHGFTLRGNPQNLTVVEASNSAFTDGAKFLSKYLF